MAMTIQEYEAQYHVTLSTTLRSMYRQLVLRGGMKEQEFHELAVKNSATVQRILASSGLDKK